MGQNKVSLEGYARGPVVDIKTGKFLPNFAKFFISFLAKISHGIHDYDFEIIAGSFSCVGTTISWTDVQITFGDQRYSIDDDSTTSVWVYWDLATPTEFKSNATFPTLSTTRAIVGKRTTTDTFKELWGEQWKIVYLDLINDLFTGYIDLYEIQGLGVSSSRIDFADVSGTDTLRMYVNSILNLAITATYVNIATELRIGGDKVVGAQETGWTAPTGSADRSGFATHTGQTITNPPTQAEVQNIDDKLVEVSEALKALIDDLGATSGHGLIDA